MQFGLAIYFEQSFCYSRDKFYEIFNCFVRKYLLYSKWSRFLEIKKESVKIRISEGRDS